MKKIIRRFFALPIVPTLLIVLSAAAFLVLVFSTGDGSFLNYAAYLYSAYALIVGTSGLCRLFPWLKRRLAASRVTGKLHENEQLAKYLDDPIYRTQISLAFSMAVNAAYILIKLVSGILYRSDWLIVFAVYYVVLTLLRVSLVNYVRRNSVKENIKAEYRRYRWIGILLLAMNLVLSVIIARMIVHRDANDYPGVLIYAMAAYTFYAVILAVINVFRFRVHGSPVISAVKAVSLTAALMSMLSLEAAMLARFGGEDDVLFRSKMLGISGLGFSIIILGMAVYMIVNATKHLKQLEAENHE